MKRAFKMKYKAFFIIFKGPSLKQTKDLFLEVESPTLNATPSCQTLSAALQIYKEIPFTSAVWFLPNASCISYIIDSSREIHESLRRKPGLKVQFSTFTCCNPILQEQILVGEVHEC